jgi:hypothetical protein
MNYDFKSNWFDIVVPLLSLPKVKESIKKGITKWINSQNCYIGTVYDASKCPASYGRGDGWAMHMNEYEDKLRQKLRLTGYLKPYIEDTFDGKEDPDAIYWKHYEAEISQMEPFVKSYEQIALRAYQMFGACHWWNPTFCLTLARIIYPNEVWRVQRGLKHTTVVNKDKSLVFDILYYDEKDDTRGGSKALLDSKK